MFKNYFVAGLSLVLGGFVLFGTNPDYKQHEILVSTTCQGKATGKSTTMCPLGYGKKSTSNFDKKQFKVYSAGILSYSTYEDKFSSIGILGNVYLTMDTIDA